MEEQNGRMPLVDNIPSFTVAGETIKPKINLYSSENGESTTYTYNLSNKNDVMFYSTIGIADGKDFKGEVIIIRDGNIVVQYNEVYNQAIENLVIHLNNANEIKIIISGNAKLWDVGLSEEKH
ncbi:hypothetical protein [Gottschalkia acidurici]|uniref:hypothetical protein n=1 Tax=Clostridium acidurici TaxID=1556 RepID=UPI001E2D67B2|nr:hypothetical protein [Gottschalkia acidurici]